MWIASITTELLAWWKNPDGGGVGFQSEGMERPSLNMLDHGRLFPSEDMSFESADSRAYDKTCRMSMWEDSRVWGGGPSLRVKGAIDPDRAKRWPSI